MSVCLSVCAIGCSFFQGLSLAFRSHDQIPASHWSTPAPPVVVVVFFVFVFVVLVVVVVIVVVVFVVVAVVVFLVQKFIKINAQKKLIFGSK